MQALRVFWALLLQLVPSCGHFGTNWEIPQLETAPTVVFNGVHLGQLTIGICECEGLFWGRSWGRRVSRLGLEDAWG